MSRDLWLTARKDLLAQEKAALRASDQLNAQLRDFPMVKVDKDYIFEGRNGKVKLADLFEGREQLIVYHFMLSPESGSCPQLPTIVIYLKTRYSPALKILKLNL